MVTMAEVAEHSGVSSSTVSHVLNGTRYVSDPVRERVEQAVAELGYRRNSAARTLAGGRSHTIGLAISGLTNPYFGPLLHAIEQHVSAAGYVLVLGDTHDEPGMERRVIESLLDRAVDGIIIAPSHGFISHGAGLINAAGTPTVVIDRSVDARHDELTPENSVSTEELTAHLIAHGHRRIAAVAGLPGLASSTERLSGYRRALEHAGIAPDEALIVPGDSNAEAGERVVLDLLAGARPPTALVSLNNAMTIGALRAVRRAGLRVPDDLALVAYDDFEWSDLFQPGLTAVAQNVSRLGTEAVDVLFDRIAGDDRPVERRIIPTELRIRNSCGCADAPL